MGHCGFTTLNRVCQRTSWRDSVSRKFTKLPCESEKEVVEAAYSESKVWCPQRSSVLKKTQDLILQFYADLNPAELFHVNTHFSGLAFSSGPAVLYLSQGNHFRMLGVESGARAREKPVMSPAHREKDLGSFPQQVHFIACHNLIVYTMYILPQSRKTCSRLAVGFFFHSFPHVRVASHFSLFPFIVLLQMGLDGTSHH